MSIKSPKTTLTEPRRIDHATQLGRLVAEGRKSLRLTQEQFAAKVNISRKTLSEFERGAGNVSLASALRAVTLAGINLSAAPRRPRSLNEVLSEQARQQNLSRRVPHASTGEEEDPNG